MTGRPCSSLEVRREWTRPWYRGMQCTDKPFASGINVWIVELCPSLETLQTYRWGGPIAAVLFEFDVVFLINGLGRRRRIYRLNPYPAISFSLFLSSHLAYSITFILTFCAQWKLLERTCACLFLSLPLSLCCFANHEIT